MKKRLENDPDGRIAYLIVRAHVHASRERCAALGIDPLAEPDEFVRAAESLGVHLRVPPKQFAMMLGAMLSDDNITLNILQERRCYEMSLCLVDHYVRTRRPMTIGRLVNQIINGDGDELFLTSEEVQDFVVRRWNKFLREMIRERQEERREQLVS